MSSDEREGDVKTKCYGECFAPYYVGFRIMARERMAKLIKYDHFEGRIGHITTYFMTSQISMIMIMKNLSS